MADNKKSSSPDAKLKLKDVKVVFWNPEDTGFGTSITIDCTDKAVRKQIEDWVEKNNIGKAQPGVANIKEYKKDDYTPVVLQYQFKINGYTKIAGINGLGEDDLGYGAVVDLIAQAYTYNNKFTGGKEMSGQSASAIVVKQGAATGGDADLAELLGEASESPDSEIEAPGIPF